MSIRRNLLMSYLSTQSKWLPYSMSYLFNSIIPSTISGKSVKDKARLGTLYGNSEVVNQLSNPANYVTETFEQNGISATLNKITGEIIVSGTATADTTIYLFNNNQFNFKVDHNYLICGCPKGGSSSTYYLRLYFAGIERGIDIGNGLFFASYTNASANALSIVIKSGIVISGSITFKPQLIDLTQEYPFDTPTSLTDVRVQNIIARIERGEILPYNTGTIKNSIVSEISYSRLPNEYQEVEYLESHGTEYIDSGIYSNDCEKVILDLYTINISGGLAFGTLDSNLQARQFGWGGSGNNWSFRVTDTTYYNSNVSAGIRNKIEFSFKNQNFYLKINGTSLYTNSDDYPSENLNAYIFARNNDGTANAFATTRIYSCKIFDNNVLVRNFIPCYRKIDNVAGLYDLVNGVFYTNAGTGTFAVGSDVNYGKIQLPAPMEFAGVNTAQNSFSVTKTAYVFTRNVFDVDLGDYNYTYSTRFVIPNTTLGIKSQITNVMVSNKFKFMGVGSDSMTGDNQCYSGLENFGFRYDSANGDTTTFKNYVKGTHLSFELATPQVINIPRKHLGAVDLGSLTYIKSTTGTGRFYSQDISGYKQSVDVKAFCSKYSFEGTGSYAGNYYGNNNSIKLKYNSTTPTSQEVYIVDEGKDSLTVEQFKEAMSGIYLFFETQNEAPDFVDETQIQSGGVLNARQPRLPQEFQEVEYIESTGTQYIDTGFKPNYLSIIETKCSATNPTNGNIFGSRTSSGVGYYGVSLITIEFSAINYGYRLLYNDSYDRYSFEESDEQFKTVRTLKIDSGKLYIDGIERVSITNASFSCVYNAYLFAHNTYGTASICSNLKCYYLKIYDNGTLIRDYIPCYRKSDSVIGLYDLVNGVFYTNAGTGTFLKGKDIVSPVCEVLSSGTFNFKCK